MKLIDKHIDHVIGLCKKHEVKELYVFGSILSDDFNNTSDIDFLVQFGEVPLFEYFDNYMNLKESLELLFKRQIDLVEAQTIKNPILKNAIDKNKTMIYGRTDSQVVV